MTQHIITASNYLLSPISEFLRTLSTLPNNIANSYRRSKSARNTMNELCSLTDAELNDIGITRGDIRYIAYHPAEQDSHRHAGEQANYPSNNNLKGWV